MNTQVSSSTDTKVSRFEAFYQSLCEDYQRKILYGSQSSIVESKTCLYLAKQTLEKLKGEKVEK